MSLRRTLLLSAIAITLLALVFGCGFGVTIDQRLEQFITDLNVAIRDNTMYLNLDPGLADYDALAIGAYWDGAFPDGGTTPAYGLTGISINDAGDGTATVLAMIAGPGSFGGPWSIEFGLVRIGFDWFIGSITLDGFPVVPIPTPA
jgi:hypothetical protein